MKTTPSPVIGIALAGVLALIVLPARAARADTFGSGANTFNIDFVDIGNAGNGADSSTGYGAVPYNYRMGTYQISQDQINKATASGLTSVTAGPWTGSQPATDITWYEVAAFVNWMNTSTGHPLAYNLDASATTLTLWSSGQAWQAGGENLYRNKDAYYFLPSEDEYYKAAYHQNDGVTANYWLYATGSNTIPTAVASGTGAGTAVYNGVTSSPATVNSAGGLSPYGTMGQSGNVFEWQESAYDGVNNLSSENRPIRGGFWNGPESFLRSSNRGSNPPTLTDTVVGFRVASIPEPSTGVLLIGSGLMLLLRRRRGSAL